MENEETIQALEAENHRLEVDNAYLMDDNAYLSKNNHALRWGMLWRNFTIYGLTILSAVAMYSCKCHKQDKDELFRPMTKRIQTVENLTEIEKNGREIDDKERCRKLGLDPVKYFTLKANYDGSSR